MKLTQQMLSAIATIGVLMITPELRSSDPENCVKEATGGTCIGPQTAMCSNYCEKIDATLTTAKICGTEAGRKVCVPNAISVGGTRTRYFGYVGNPPSEEPITDLNINECSGCSTTILYLPQAISEGCTMVTFGSACITTENN